MITIMGYVFVIVFFGALATAITLLAWGCLRGYLPPPPDDFI